MLSIAQWDKIFRRASAIEENSCSNSSSGSLRAPRVFSLPAVVVRSAVVAATILAPLTALQAASDYATPYTITTFAGDPGVTGSADGTGSSARFDLPNALAFDSAGNLYVADTYNFTIRKVTPSGSVSTVAGTAGTFGVTDGKGSAALFHSPSGIAVDSAGNIFVSDTGNNDIRKITPDGTVSTFAGANTMAVGFSNAGYADGTGPAAKFNSPEGLVVDSADNLYVADAGNNVIRKITPSAVVTTLAGSAGQEGPAYTDGTGSAARFNGPQGLAIDSAGNIYVADSGNNEIRKIAPGAIVTTLAGKAGTYYGSSDGTGQAALFNAPGGVAVDGAGNIYVSDSFNDTIRKIDPQLNVTTLAGQVATPGTADGTGSAAQFYIPTGIVSDSAGNLFIADSYNATIRKGVPSGSSPTPTPTPTPTPVASNAPVFATQPISVVVSGGTVALYASASNSPSYQWSLNGSPIAGATDPILLLSNAAAAAGRYTVTASNAAGSATSNPATVATTSTTNIGRLVNISCRSQVGTGASILIAGFVVGGTDTSGSESLLIRASGPALVPFGVTGTLPDPQLNLYSGSSLLGTNNGWAGSAQIASTAASVGAFAFTDTSSHDAALLETLQPGAYTAQVSGASGDTGVALAEVYDATPAGSYTSATPRLVNISARVQVGTGGNILIAGFAIGGATSRTVLIRASGPALVPFGVTGTLPDPQLQLYSGATLLGTNNGWGGDTNIMSTAASVGAFAWSSPSSHDSAILVTLPPGAYTAQVAGASGDTGVALVEVYEVP